MARPGKVVDSLQAGMAPPEDKVLMICCVINRVRAGSTDSDRNVVGRVRATHCFPAPADQLRKCGAVRQADLARHCPLAVFPMAQGVLKDGALRLDIGDGLRQVLRRVARRQFLMGIEPGQHLAVLLQLFTQRLDQIL